MLRLVKLQWGRARASAEIRRPLQRRKRLIVASMGPRSCERGNDPELRDDLRKPESFNGAALVRARKCLVVSITCCQYFLCFNGAALVRARKYTVSLRSLPSRRGFNGAALVRARKWSADGLSP